MNLKLFFLIISTVTSFIGRAISAPVEKSVESSILAPKDTKSDDNLTEFLISSPEESNRGSENLTPLLEKQTVKDGYLDFDEIKEDYINTTSNENGNLPLGKNKKEIKTSEPHHETNGTSEPIKEENTALTPMDEDEQKILSPSAEGMKEITEPVVELPLDKHKETSPPVHRVNKIPSSIQNLEETNSPMLEIDQTAQPVQEASLPIQEAKRTSPLNDGVEKALPLQDFDQNGSLKNAEQQISGQKAIETSLPVQEMKGATKPTVDVKETPPTPLPQPPPLRPPPPPLKEVKEITPLIQDEFEPVEELVYAEDPVYKEFNLTLHKTDEKSAGSLSAATLITALGLPATSSLIQTLLTAYALPNGPLLVDNLLSQLFLIDDNLLLNLVQSLGKDALKKQSLTIEDVEGFLLDDDNESLNLMKRLFSDATKGKNSIDVHAKDIPPIKGTDKYPDFESPEESVPPYYESEDSPIIYTPNMEMTSIKRPVHKGATTSEVNFNRKYNARVPQGLNHIQKESRQPAPSKHYFYSPQPDYERPILEEYQRSHVGNSSSTSGSTPPPPPPPPRIADQISRPTNTPSILTESSPTDPSTFSSDSQYRSHPNDTPRLASSDSQRFAPNDQSRSGPNFPYRSPFSEAPRSIANHPRRSDLSDASRLPTHNPSRFNQGVSRYSENYVGPAPNTHQRYR